MPGNWPWPCEVWPPTTCWTATTPNATRSRRKWSSAPSATPAPPAPAPPGLSNNGDDATTTLQRQAQLLVAYPHSPLIQPQTANGTPPATPAPGDRAPDCRGLLSDLAGYPRRLFDLLRTPRHVLLLFAGPQHATGDGTARLEACATAAQHAAHGLLDAYLITAAEVPQDARPVGLHPPRVHDAANEFHNAYTPRDGEALLIRPDGYICGRFHPALPEHLTEHLRRTFITPTTNTPHPNSTRESDSTDAIEPPVPQT
ncbi:hypothetical protein [Streptomyces sp. NPDC056105]|uniref:aromatic-ring hydroxylase C-terminal domain-containing protein n=1 Tax=Streptomyces sp. NPDC056105 TaxID=3345714 RepID=UPI0035DF0B15